ncbi:hypothetical protein [Edaphobacter modestus]|nr:hypothetical protein [Edaphobacter modestus]
MYHLTSYDRKALLTAIVIGDTGSAIFQRFAKRERDFLFRTERKRLMAKPGRFLRTVAREIRAAQKAGRKPISVCSAHELTLGEGWLICREVERRQKLAVKDAKSKWSKLSPEQRREIIAEVEAVKQILYDSIFAAYQGDVTDVAPFGWFAEARYWGELTRNEYCGTGRRKKSADYAIEVLETIGDLEAVIAFGVTLDQFQLVIDRTIAGRAGRRKNKRKKQKQSEAERTTRYWVQYIPAKIVAAHISLSLDNAA